MCPHGLVIFGQRAIVTQSAGVTKQLRQRDLGGNVQRGQPLPYRIAKAQRADFRQAQHANRGQRLRDAVDRKERVRWQIRDRRAEFTIHADGDRDPPAVWVHMAMSLSASIRLDID